ncbi:MAG: hypothetical protein PWP63_1918, partial [Methanolobus sp.]|nr:hypothetical protein [Methanolobus sp.]
WLCMNAHAACIIPTTENTELTEDYLKYMDLCG